MLGIKYLIVPKDAPPGGEGIWPVFVDDPLVDIHLNTLALPRVWLVYRTEVVGSYGEALERVLDENFRPEEVAIVQNGPHLNGTARGKLNWATMAPTTWSCTWRQMRQPCWSSPIPSIPAGARQWTVHRFPSTRPTRPCGEFWCPLEPIG
jgi:hypothetical protein